MIRRMKMSKKLMIALALILSVVCVFAACFDGGTDGSESKVDSTPASSTEPTSEEEQIKYEGEMLFNGFDTVDDLYAVEQLYEWSYTPLGKLDIVGKDNFIPEPSELEKEEYDKEAVDKLIEAIDALPAAEEVTISDIDAIRKARKAYGALNDASKKKVTNLAVLKAAESAEAIQNCYTLSDLDGEFANDLTIANGWESHGATLKNEKEGTIVFKVKGMAEGNSDNPGAGDGAFYVNLFHDATKNKNESGNGVSMWVRNNNNTLLFQNVGTTDADLSTGMDIGFKDGAKISGAKTYVFYYTYKVEEDYSKLTVSVKIVEEGGATVVEGSKEITTVKFAEYGFYTIEQWLTEHENKDAHKTININSGNSSGVKVSSAWPTVSASDYEEPAAEERNPEDLSPRQGDGALRVYYKSGTFKEILARFERSKLKGLPKKELGAISVKVYNDSAKEKTVTLALVGAQNQIIAINGGEFKLTPYAWTTCSVTLDPIIVDSIADTLTGLSINLSDKSQSAYYIDDLKVTFGKTYTDETRELLAKVETLKTDVAALENREISANDKELLEGLYTRYNELPQGYRFIVGNSDLLTNAISSYLKVLKLEEESATGDVTTLRFNEILGLTQLSEFVGGKYSFSADEHPQGETGSVKFDFDGSSTTGVTVRIAPTKANGFDELHVWVKNASQTRRAVWVDWKSSAEQFDEEGNSLNIPGGYVLPANSGWIKLVIKSSFTISELNVTSISNDTPSGIATVDTLYVGKIVAVSNANKVNEIISALPAYEEGYSAENKAAVKAAREAYNALCLDSAAKVTEIAKLVSLEADIWREGFKNLPATADELTEYKNEYKAAIDSLRETYELLNDKVKKVVVEDEAKLRAFEAKILTFRAQSVNEIVAGTELKDTLYTVDEIKKIKSANETYALMSDEEKTNLNEGVEAKLTALTAKIAKYHTLRELDGDFTHDITNAPEWAGNSASLKNDREGTLVFKVKGMVSAAGALYINLFHDTRDKNQSLYGIVLLVQGHKQLLFPNAGDQAIGFNDGVISPAKTYVFYYTYKVADDDSKLTVSVRVDEEGGATIAEGTKDITTVKIGPKQEVTEYTFKQWFTSLGDYKVININSGASKGASISSAW